MWLGELRSTNPLRIPHPKIDKLACQAQGAGIFAKGEITLQDATIYIFNLRNFDRKLSTNLPKILAPNSEKARIFKGLYESNSDETEFLSSQPRYDHFAYPTVAC